jgi:hypothetical protein
MDSSEIVLLNARGVKFEILLKQMEVIPNSRLAKLKTLIEESKLSKLTPERIAHFEEFCDNYDPDLNEFYFNKDPNLLEFALSFYETKTKENAKVHIDLGHVCLLEIESEIENYWQIIDFKSYLEPCCIMIFERDVEKLEKKIDERNAMIKEFYHKEDFGKYCFPKLREKIWNFLEYPSSSIYAKIYTILSLLIVSLAVFDIGEFLIKSSNLLINLSINFTFKCFKQYQVSYLMMLVLQ